MFAKVLQVFFIKKANDKKNKKQDAMVYNEIYIFVFLKRKTVILYFKNVAVDGPDTVVPAAHFVCTELMGSHDRGGVCKSCYCGIQRTSQS